MGKANSGAFDKDGKKVRFTKSTHGDLQVYVPSDSKGDAFLAENGDQLMLFSKEALLERSASGTRSLADSDNLRSFTQGQPAQFRLQLDMYGLVDMLSSMGESPKDMNLKQILSSRDLTINAFYDGKVSKASMLIPINIPELIRFIGKQAKEGGMGGGNRRSMGSVPPPGAFPMSPRKVARGPLAH